MNNVILHYTLILKWDFKVLFKRLHGDFEVKDKVRTGLHTPRRKHEWHETVLSKGWVIAPGVQLTALLIFAEK